jgi:hypothetical protein
VVVNGGREWIEDGWLAFLNEFLLLATGVLFYEVGSVRLVGTVWRSWIEELELGVFGTRIESIAAPHPSAYG